jgi:tryptophanyl-tRNA synthetase
LTTGAEGKKRSRVVSGMRPTGRLHIGHYFGALENWVRLQNETVPDGVGREGQARLLQGQEDISEKDGHGSAVPLRGGEKAYECFYFIADWHALTSDYADTSGVAQNTIEIMTDYLAAGLDPEKSVIFQQSLVPEHAELHLLLSMVTPLSWLERVPTYKEALEQVKDKDLHNYGFLGYPCLQTADIVIYSEEGAQLYVPVGEDQVSHVELSREIVRRFNAFYGLSIADKFYSALDLILSDPKKYNVERNVINLFAGIILNAKPPLENVERQDVSREVHKYATELGVQNFLAKWDEHGEYVSFRENLCEPGVMLTKTPRIPGLDGRKMSKSYGNAITLSETDEEIRKKTKVMVTDPARKRRTDPGNPDVCPVYDWHKLFSAGEAGRLEWVRAGCTTAGIGCIECKSAMAENLIKWIAPVRERRVKWEKDPKGVIGMIEEGSKRARVEAKKTMERVREAVFHWNGKRNEILGAE